MRRERKDGENGRERSGARTRALKTEPRGLRTGAMTLPAIRCGVGVVYAVCKGGVYMS
jgi:hypothetical protein